MTSLADAREGDQTLIHRCRLIATGVIRLASLWLLWEWIQSTIHVAYEFTRLRALGGPRVDPFALVLVGLSFASALMLWLSAGWLARMAFRMPPGRNQCPKCRYPVKDLDANSCPECGTRIR